MQLVIQSGGFCLESPVSKHACVILTLLILQHTHTRHVHYLLKVNTTHNYMNFAFSCFVLAHLYTFLSLFVVHMHAHTHTPTSALAS